MIVIFLLEWDKKCEVKFITETIIDYMEESHFHYQSHSIPNYKNHTALKNN